MVFVWNSVLKVAGSTSDPCHSVFYFSVHFTPHSLFPPLCINGAGDILSGVTLQWTGMPSREL